MTTNLKSLADYAEMSQAAYLDFSSVIPNNSNALEINLRTDIFAPDKKFAQKQAQEFSDSQAGFSFLAHSPGTNGNDTYGFSATVFRSNADGAYIIAVRGTEPDAQYRLDLWQADALGVVLSGKAIYQLISAYRYYKELTTSAGGTVFYSQAERTEIANLYTYELILPFVPLPSVAGLINVVIPQSVKDTVAQLMLGLDSDTGLGKIPAGSAVNFTGHSLGGHVATLLAEMIANNYSGNLVASVNTYNAPGQGGIPAILTNLLGIPTGTDGGALAGKIFNAYGDGGVSITAGLGSMPGVIQPIFTEADGWLNVNNHSIVKLSDSLAFQELLASIDGTVSIDMANKIERALSATMPDSLEKGVAAIYKLFKGVSISIPVGDREVYYSKIFEAKSTIDQTAAFVNLQLVSLIDSDAPSLVSSAESSVAYRYALRELNSFVVTGLSYSQHNANGELNLYVDAATTPSGITSQYIADRAAFLSAKNAANAIDASSVVVANQTDNWRYIDVSLRSDVTAFGSAPATIQRRAVFGGDSSDALAGGVSADRLYGGRGADVLTGGKGDDYLEGGAGQDLYQYVASRSVLGSLANDGADEVRDTDGKGLIRYSYTQAGILSDAIQSKVAGGIGIKIADGQWQSPDGKFTYTQQFAGLNVTINGDAGGSIRILDFDYAKAGQGGYLGIRLVDAASVPQSPDRIFLGDKQNWDSDGNAGNGVQTQDDGFGNLIRADGQSGRPDSVFTDRADVFYGAATGTAAVQGERFTTGGGDDTVYGDGASSATSTDGGRDLIETGAGRDSVAAGAGADWVEGGADADMLAGNAGDDVLWADTSNGQTVTLAQAITSGESGSGAAGQGDLLIGNAGNDTAIGAATADLLIGEAEGDVLVGGQGDDTIYGDGLLGSVSADWSLTRTQTTTQTQQGPSFSIALVQNNLSVGEANAEGSADTIYGGAGADWVFAGEGDDYVEGGEGNDVVRGDGGSDILVGGAGNDWLFGDGDSFTTVGVPGDDYLDGGAGEDMLFGGAGADILIGGADADTLIGGAGQDTYVFNRGDGKDLLIDVSTGAEASVLVFGEGFSPNDLTIRPGSMLLDFGQGDSVDLGSFNHNDPNAPAAFDSLAFADGTTLTFQDVLDRGFTIDGTEEDDDGHDAAHPVLVGTAFKDTIHGLGGNDELQGREGDDILYGAAGDDRLYGMNGNDSLFGGDGADALVGGAGEDVLDGGDGRDALWGDVGDDVLNGGAGSDLLIGGAGDDTYVFGAGDQAFDFSGATTIAFTEGVAATDLELRRQVVNNSYPVYSVGMNGAPESERMFVSVNEDSQLARFAFADGTVLDHEALLHETWVDQQLLTGSAGDDLLDAYAGNDWLRGGEGNDVLIGRRGNDRLDGEAGDDTLNGGAGDDTLMGGDGADTYLYARGDGDDRLTDDGDTASTDTLRFTDIASTEVTVARQANGDLVASVAGGGSVTVADYYNTASRKIERIEFADGAFMDAGALGALTVPPIAGTAGDDVLVGTPYADAILGGEGNDTLDGGGGADTLEGGPGADRYRLPGFGGIDRAVEDGAETSTVTLDPGIGFNALQASRSGDDLVIGLRNSASGLALADFYAGQTNWSVQTATGETKTAQDLIDYLASAPAPGTPAEYRQAYLDSARAQYAAYLASFGANGGVQVNVQAPTDAATIFKDPPYYESGSGGTYFLNIGDITGGPSANTVDLRSSGPAMVDAGADNDLIDNQGWGFDNTSPFVSIGSFLNGGAGVDWIFGSWAADTLYGGGGNDILVGSDGNDTYVVFAGDVGNVTIDEVTIVNLFDGHSGFPGARDSSDILVLSGIAFADTSLNVGLHPMNLNFATLDITWSTGSVSLALPDASDPYLTQFPGHSYGVETIRFADGTVLTQSQILQEVVKPTAGTPGDGTTVNGTAVNDTLSAPVFFSPAGLTEFRTTLNGLDGNDSLTGGGQNDVLNGGPGNDFLLGGEGDDVLVGGTGDDQLYGGEGNDVYVFDPDWGKDFLNDSIGTGTLGLVKGTLRFGAGIAPEDIGVMDDGYFLYVVRKGTGDRIRLFGASPTGIPGNGVSRVEFADGTNWSRADLLARIGPVPGTELDDFISGTAADDTIAGLGGDDVIYGAGGNDILRGGAGADDLEVWGAGNSLIDGSADDDYIYEEGHAFVAGGAGDDTIDHNGAGGVIAFNRGDGADIVSLGESVTLSLGGGITAGDLVLAADGADYVLSMGGSDSIRLTGLDPQASSVTVQIVGDDIRSYDLFDLTAALSASTNEAWGGDVAYAYARGELDIALDDAAIRAVTGAADFGTARQIALRAPTPPVTGGENGGALFGSALNDTVTGGAGSDWLDGGAGADILAGSGGNDLLTGGLGADTYVYNAGDGVDTIADPSSAGEPNTLSFGAGIDPGMLTLGLGSLLVRVGDSGGALHLTSFDPDNPFGARDVDRFLFADGGELSYEQLLARGFDLYGTAGADDISGTSIVDRIRGHLGGDLLAGGGGGDTYFFNVGDGADTIVENPDPSAIDVLQFGTGIEPAGTRVTRTGDDLVVSLSSTGDGVTLRAWFTDSQRPIERTQFADGTTWSAAELESRLVAANQPPVAVDDAANVQEDVALVASGNVLANDHDDDPGTVLSVAMPGTFSGLYGTLQLSADGNFSYALDNASSTVQALAAGQSVLEVFDYVASDGTEAAGAQLRVSVAGTNGAPALIAPLADLSTAEDAAFSFTVSATTFADEDADDALALSASLADGTALPGWLYFDAGAGFLSGTPANADVGAYEIRFTATDLAGASAGDVFRLDVANVNDAPAVASPLEDLSVAAGTQFVFVVPADTFVDVDAGDSFAVSAALFGGAPLPAWLSFSAATGTFAGTPQDSDIGISHVAVSATDGSGASVVSDFGLIVRAADGSRVTGTSGDDVMYGNTGDETLIARGGDDALFGESGDDILRGDSGNDVLQGGAGDDVLRGGTGDSLLDGGTGNDLIFSGNGDSFISGGAGNDAIRLGSGNNVVAFGRGDGTDTLYGGADGGNTLSFGGGIRYSDLTLARSGSDLVVGTGGDDRIVLKDWYGGAQSVLNLQLILDATADFDAGAADPLYNRRVQSFDFRGLVAQFDQAFAQSPGLTSWAMTNALLQFHLSGADDAALGGDLAYWYGRNRTLTGMSLAAAQQVIGAAGFGSEAQSLHEFSGLRDGFVKLS